MSSKSIKPLDVASIPFWPEAVLPLGGRLGRQISGGGKFFKKKLKIGVFLALQENETDCRPVELRLQFAATMLPLPLIPVLPPPSTPAPPHHNLAPTNTPDRIRLRGGVKGRGGNKSRGGRQLVLLPRAAGELNPPLFLAIRCVILPPAHVSQTQTYEAFSSLSALRRMTSYHVVSQLTNDARYYCSSWSRREIHLTNNFFVYAHFFVLAGFRRGVPVDKALSYLCCYKQAEEPVSRRRLYFACNEHRNEFAKLRSITVSALRVRSSAA
jgi:hypothetical protein